MSTQVVLFGHSFVSRFQTFCARSDIVNLGLDQNSFSVSTIGFGGLSLRQRRRFRNVEDRLCSADIVILDIGSNDLASCTYYPEQFALDLLSYASYLVIGLDVKKVVVTQIIRRSNVPFPDYNSHVIRANTALQTAVNTTDPPIYFWKHRGMWNSPVSILNADGIHLSNEVGYPKYLRSIRDCIIRVSNWNLGPKASKDATDQRTKTRRRSSTATSATNLQTNDDQPLPVSSVGTDTAAIVESVINVLERRGIIPTSTQTTEQLQSENSQHQLPANNDSLIGSVNNLAHNDSAENIVMNLGVSPTADQPQHTGDINVQVQQALGIVPGNNYQLSLPPGALTSEKLKQAIWANEYVDFHTLLDKNAQQDEILIKVSQEGSNISVAPKDSGKHLSIAQWLTAFTIFMDIYTTKRPQETSDLLAYMHRIRELERSYGAAAFNFYDINFRRQRQILPVPWSAMAHDLYIRAAAPTMTNNMHSPVVQKHCFKYNKLQGCTNQTCSYAHVCSICRKRHPAFKCFSRQKSANTNQSLTAAPGLPSKQPLEKSTSQPFRANPNTRQK